MDIRIFRFKFATAVLGWLFILEQTLTASNLPANVSEDELKERILNMNCLVEIRIDEDVIEQVKRYVLQDRGTSKLILARTEQYFNLMDKILMENDLPLELKYLTVVESALNPSARSHMGAVGLWQFMPQTAKHRGLRVDGLVDQRMDVINSTLAAVRYFKLLYEEFGDWSLVIAAYNAGEYRIRKLVEETKAKNFWELKKHLPRQTQKFVPAFIGVSYLMQFYWVHDLAPDLSTYKDEKVTFAKIYDEVKIGDMLKRTGIPASVFEHYNPAFKKSTIPASAMGNAVVLPDSLMIEFIDYYLQKHFNGKWNADMPQSSTGEAKKLPEIISFVRPYFIYPQDIIEQQANENRFVIENTAVDLKGIAAFDKIIPTSKLSAHLVRKRETLQDIASNYHGVTVEDLISWNAVDLSRPLMEGTVLWIRKL